MSRVEATRYHDISCGHRVVGHEGKCRHLHGHNYRVHFTCQADTNVAQLDLVGRVIDFSVMKEKLCMWLEKEWDHKMLLWEHDPVGATFLDDTVETGEGTSLDDGLVFVPFNPTAENIAKHLVEVVGPAQLKDTGVRLVRCVVEETSKCSATYTLVLP